MEKCTCPLRPNMTYDELMSEIFLPEKQCCSTKVNPARGWVCSNALRELERARKERDIRKRYSKKKGRPLTHKSNSVTLSPVNMESF